MLLQWRLHLFHILILTLILSQQSPSIIQGLMVEEKTRLGSTPPTCHNKCNQCHPCMAVQAPSLPSHHRFHPSSTTRLLPLHDSQPPPPPQQQQQQPPYYNKYSNYKPLGWKCRCGDHFYNP